MAKPQPLTSRTTVKYGTPTIGNQPKPKIVPPSKSGK
jgi:hypothetical protein